MSVQDVRRAFEERFGAAPAVTVRAPGRVNLIGEHTDTSDGFVLPMAIDREVQLALTPRSDSTVRVVALDLHRDHEASFDARTPSVKEGWASYAHGVAWALGEAGHTLRGFDAVFSGDVPRGAGLSSSAALELAFARAFSVASDLPWDAKAMAVACRRAENGWVGVASGIMDQLVSACGEEDSAVLIDCRSLDTCAVPLPAGTQVVILDTGTRRGLVGSAYNERRAQVDAAAAAFGVPMLRDVDMATFDARASELDEVVRRRARHVISENARVLHAVQAMEAGDAVALGALMNASHASLKEDFEVTGPALDAMTEIAQAHPACFGARMTGAGFAGCCVALVDEARVAWFMDAVGPAFEAATGESPSLYAVRPTAGAGLLTTG